MDIHQHEPLAMWLFSLICPSICGHFLERPDMRNILESRPTKPQVKAFPNSVVTGWNVISSFLQLTFASHPLYLTRLPLYTRYFMNTEGYRWLAIYYEANHALYYSCIFRCQAEFYWTISINLHFSTKIDRLLIKRSGHEILRSSSKSKTNQGSHSH